MGDTIEITTWPNHQNLFYPMSSSALAVEIKGQSHAQIGLARKPGSKCDYWIGIAENGNSWIKRNGRRVVSERTPDIVTGHEYKKFWITWHKNVVRFGRHGETEPVLQAGGCPPGLQYITVGNMEHSHLPVVWRLQLAPLQVMRPIKMKNIACGTLTWITPGDQLPDCALIGGFENEFLYIIKAHHRGSLTPGKFVPSEGVGYISWGGQAHSKGDIEVLCGFDCVWVPTSENNIPAGAVEGGRSEVHSEPLYVGRAHHEGHLIPGKVQPSHKVCYIAHGGQEIGLAKYEILVDPNADTHCVNRMFTIDDDPNDDNDSYDEDEDYEDE